jgi:ATP-dependent DNA helicase PIF1
MIDRKPLELNADFQYVLDALENKATNLFITGRAGTGKSTLLQLFRNTSRKKLAVLAPTGVAALNVQGQTIHSFFGFPPRMFASHEIKKRRDRRLYKALEILIIDEISMVRADTLDHIDQFLRIHRENPMPFGGVQVVFFGDLFQLPPVLSSAEESGFYFQKYASPFFFSAHVIADGFGLEMVELQKVYRQEQRHFLRLLDSVRLNQADYEDIEALNERCLPDFESEDFYITLCSRNAKADSINQAALSCLKGAENRYVASIFGDFNPAISPADPVLKLRDQAQVMFLKNDPDRRYVNGTIGKVLQCKDHSAIVEIESRDGQRQAIEVNAVEWETIRYNFDPENPDRIKSEVIGAFKQLPLRLAWAVTIHKAQGKTFDKVIIDLDKGAFEHGQTYVALSRCRTMEGIILRKPIRPSDIRTDERILEFYQHRQS